jgi:hypothetical protein
MSGGNNHFIFVIQEVPYVNETVAIARNGSD